MGMFDSVYIDCECGNAIELQSKAGACNLESYRLEEAPPQILGDLAGQIAVCEKCNTSYRIGVITIARAIKQYRIKEGGD